MRRVLIWLKRPVGILTGAGIAALLIIAIAIPGGEGEQAQSAAKLGDQANELITPQATAVLTLAGYSPPRDLTRTGQYAYEPQVAVDPGGLATIVWYGEDNSGFDRVQAVRLDADGMPGAVHTLSPAGVNARSPQVAVDPEGRATVVWTLSGQGHNDRIQAARLLADGVPGGYRTLSEDGEDASDPEVAVDSQGRATVVWSRPLASESGRRRIEFARIPAVFGDPVTVQRIADPSFYNYRPQVAVDPDSRATVTWDTNAEIHAVRIDPAETLGTIHTLSTDGENASASQVAVDPNGRATVVWWDSGAPAKRVRTCRLGVDGNPGAVRTISRAGEPTNRPQVAVDPQGQATVVWAGYPDGSPQPVEAVLIDANDVPGAVHTLSAAGQDASAPQVAVGTDGRATVAWDSYSSEFDESHIWAVRLGATGTPGTVYELSKARDPQISVDPQGRATVLWSLHNFGSDRIIQVSQAQYAPLTTSIDSGPAEGVVVNRSEVTFTFSGKPVAGIAGFECRLDDVQWSGCSSPHKSANLTNREYRFAVRAVDKEDQRDPVGATRNFTVDTTVYKARIGKVKVKGPAKVKRAKKATYKVTVSNSGNAEATGIKLQVKGKGVKAKKAVGTIPAGASKTVKVKLKFKKPGKVKTTFKVTSSNAGGKTVRKTIKVKK